MPAPQKRAHPLAQNGCNFLLHLYHVVRRIKGMGPGEYVFRWKKEYGGVAVEPSRHATREETWEWALKSLRIPGINDRDAKRQLRKMGEVIKVGP